MSIKKISELNNISNNLVISETQETRDVGYKLVGQNKMRTTTEEMQYCLEEGDRRPQREEKLQLNERQQFIYSSK